MGNSFFTSGKEKGNQTERKDQNGHSKAKFDHKSSQKIDAWLDPMLNSIYSKYDQYVK